MREVTRFEYKYMISYLDYFKLIDIVKELLIHDKHGDEDSYSVNSIYLDDIYHSGAMDKAFGNQYHKKYRIRYYDDKSKKKLEQKYKVGDVSTKTSMALNDELYEGIINQDLDILEKYFDNQLVRKFALDMLKNNLEPKCNIIYKREAFRDKSDNFRLTFDHSLEISRFDTEIDSESIKLMKDSMLILEVKYEHYLPKEIKQLLRAVSLNQIAYSKYFMGYNQLTL